MKSITTDTVCSDTSKVTYNIMNQMVKSRGALVDQGANGGIAGDDVRIIEKTDRKVDLSGIDSHKVRDLPIVMAGAVVETQRGPVIAIMHQYAYMGEHKMIHSSAQIEHYKNKVDDRSAKVGGSHCITTLDGYMIPMRFKNGLGYITMRPFTDHDWDNLPHVILIGEKDWDPSVMDLRSTKIGMNLHQTIQRAILPQATTMNLADQSQAPMRAISYSRPSMRSGMSSISLRVQIQHS